MELQITGLDQVQTRLKQAGPTLAQKAYAKALKAAGEVLRKEVSDRAPVKTEEFKGSNSLPPGALKADIQLQVKVSEQGGGATIGPSRKTAYVARFVELGHRQVSHGKKKGRKVIGHVPAKPFLRPAFDAAGDAAVQAFANSLIESLSVLEQHE